MISLVALVRWRLPVTGLTGRALVCAFCALSLLALHVVVVRNDDGVLYLYHFYEYKRWIRLAVKIFRARDSPALWEISII